MKVNRTIPSMEVIAQTTEDYKLLCIFSNFFDIPICYHFIKKEYRITIDEIDWLRDMIKKHDEGIKRRKNETPLSITRRRNSN